MQTLPNYFAVPKSHESRPLVSKIMVQEPFHKIFKTFQRMMFTWWSRRFPPNLSRANHHGPFVLFIRRQALNMQMRNLSPRKRNFEPIKKEYYPIRAATRTQL